VEQWLHNTTDTSAKKESSPILKQPFTRQLITQLRAWRAAGEGIILFADMNKNIYTGHLAQALCSDRLLMEDQTL
jgi:hypothetical protein